MPGNDSRTRVRVPDNWRPQGAPDVRADNSALVHAHEAHVETLKAQLAAAEARDAQHVADLAAGRAKTEKAISAFAALAERLDVLAAARSRPWWRRLAG